MTNNPNSETKNSAKTFPVEKRTIEKINVEIEMIKATNKEIIGGFIESVGILFFASCVFFMI